MKIVLKKIRYRESEKHQQCILLKKGGENATFSAKKCIFDEK
jgi:hypothetical protein